MPLFAALFCLGTAAGLVLFSLLWQPAATTVVITHPPAFSVAHSHYLQMKGTIASKKARVTLIVRAETDTQWWVQEIIYVNDRASLSAWTVDALLGTPSQGVGENFHIIALASPNPRLLDLLGGRDLVKGQRLKKVPDWSQSEPIIVWRNQ
jgi:hypothetical protein